jgi:hypothetical protein
MTLAHAGLRRALEKDGWELTFQRGNATGYQKGAAVMLVPSHDASGPWLAYQGLTRAAEWKITFDPGVPLAVIMGAAGPASK